MRETTLCYIEQDDSYLMLHRVNKGKQDGSFEKWLGVGGKLEKGESPDECILREVKEETGYELVDYKYRAKIYFYSDTWEDEIMYLYTATKFQGEQIECNEGNLVWVKKNEIQDLNIWEGDKLFLNRLTEDESFFELELRYKGHNLENYKWLSEYFDVVDEDGNPIGEIVERKKAHSEGIRHRTSHIWVLRDNNANDTDILSIDVLLQKRSKDKDSHPGCYDISSAGHIHAGCGFKESALRELSEELGITASEEDLKYVGKIKTYRETRPYGKPFIDNQVSAVFIYWCNEKMDEEKFILQPEEVESVLWMPLLECIEKVSDSESNEFKHCMRISELKMIKDYCLSMV